jgi:hypothetical protein
MPNLEDLSLDTCRLWHKPDDSTAPHSERSILLSKLETLRLCNVSGVSYLNPFRTLLMPRLRYFAFEARFASDWEMPIDWSAFFTAARSRHWYFKAFLQQL